MSKLIDLDSTELLFKAMELEDRVKELELEREELKKSINDIALYMQIEAM